MLTPTQLEESKKIDPETGVSPWEAAEKLCGYIDDEPEELLASSAIYWQAYWTFGESIGEFVESSATDTLERWYERMK